MSRSSHLASGGQTLVLMVLALVGLLTMSALVVDGGNAYAQQRATQNAADAASGAGATVLAQSLLSINGGGGPKTDADVLAAINASAAANSIKAFDPGVAGNSAAYYTNLSGDLLAASGGTTTDPALAIQVGNAAGGSIPTCPTDCVGGTASGVAATAQRTFSTVFAGVVGLTSIDSTAGATSIAGYGPTVCDAAQGCALLPLTFAVNQSDCDGTGRHFYTATEWLDLEPSGPPYDATNERILSTCGDDEGAYGWLDLCAGINVADEIETPCNNLIYFPTWLVGQPGNVNNVEDELNAYAGNAVGVYESGLDQEVLIPFFDGECNEDRPGDEPPNPPGDEAPIPGAPDPFPGVCVNNPAGGGANRYFHVPFFIGFILDRAYIEGDNRASCTTPPGSPFVAGNGTVGCLKGWFARVVAAPGPVSGDPGPAGNATPLSVQLIK